MFLKQLGPRTADIGNRQGHLKLALELVERLKVPGPPESLSMVLSGCGMTAKICVHQFGKAAANATANVTRHSISVHKQCQDGSDSGHTMPRRVGRSRGTKWQMDHKRWAKEKGLTPQELHFGWNIFKQATKDLLNNRQQDALWLKLTMLRKTMGVDWQEGIFVANIGASIHFLTVMQDLFPCVTPRMVYAILINGQLHLANGITVLAMQGIQGTEFRNFQFGKEKCSLLRDLGGNAFTANVVAAFLIAGLCFL